jgi:predicted MPP superfamily phosphohydrolase
VLAVSHAGAALAFPWLLFRFRGGLPLPLLLYAWLCHGILLLTVILAIVRRRRPRGLLEERITTLDSARELGGRPVGRGLRSWAARMPLNEAFDLNMVERHIRLAGLPTEWAGLRILHLTDLHFNGSPDRAYFEWAIDRCQPWQPDLVALTGDILDRIAFAEWLPTTLGRLSAPLGRYFVLGNHDVYDRPAEIRAALEALGYTHVGSRRLLVEHRGHRLLLTGTERPWIGCEPGVRGVPEHALRLLLSHTPARIAYARAQRMDLMLAGHFHGGQVHLPLLGPITGGRHHSGLFHLPPTMLHVSRGLGALTPYRFRCGPEAALLVLHPDGDDQHDGPADSRPR